MNPDVKWTDKFSTDELPKVISGLEETLVAYLEHRYAKEPTEDEISALRRDLITAHLELELRKKYNIP